MVFILLSFQVRTAGECEGVGFQFCMCVALSIFLLFLFFSSRRMVT